MTDKKSILQFKNSGAMKEKLQSILPPELLEVTANNNKDQKVESKKKIDPKISKSKKSEKLETKKSKEANESKGSNKPQESKEPNESPIIKKKKNKNQIPDSRYKEIHQELSDKFPNLFSTDNNIPKKVLKRGVAEDLKNHPLIEWRAAYKKFLSKYTNSYSYTASHTKGAIRYDLDGKVSGMVSDEEYNRRLQFLNSNKKPHPQNIKNQDAPEKSSD